MKIKEKHRAIQLRTEGKSLNEIVTLVDAAKSSISLWVRDVPLSATAQARIRSRRSNGQQAAMLSRLKKTREILQAASDEARDMMRTVPMTPNLALVSCALLYWCEGAKDKNDQTFTFSNSDAQLVRAFMVLMRKALVLDESKFRVRMHLHEYHDELTLRNFWSKTTTIPTHQFSKTYWKPHTAKTIKEGYPGCVHIEYYDVKVARKIYATARAFFESVVQ